MSKRMRVVSEEEFGRLNKLRKPVEHANTHFLTDKADEVSEVLHSNIPEDIKLQLYSSLMKHVTHKLREIIDKPINVNMSINHKANPKDKTKPVLRRDSSSESIKTTESEAQVNDAQFLIGLPRTKRRMGEQLLKLLRRRRDLIKWDNEGRVTFFKDEFEPLSNIKDLMFFAIRNLKHETKPSGINRFLSICDMANVSSDFYRTNLRKDVAGGLGNIPLFNNPTNSAQRLAVFDRWVPLLNEDNLNKQAEELEHQKRTEATPARKSSHLDVTLRRRL
jgi:hypothetical protein